MSFIESLFGLAGKVALVSGASRGIGSTIAGGLEQAGARVVGVARSPRPLSFPEGVEYRQADVCDGSQVREIVEDVFERFGRIDVYVHAAGISLQPTTPDRQLADFAQTVDVNLKAAYACAVIVAEPMRRAGGGSVIYITSIGSMLGFPDNPGYVASKGGLRMLTRALAVDFGKHNIRVNAVAPGYVRTAMTEASFTDPLLHEQRRRHTLLGRWGEAADVVGAVIFLASAASSYVTGQDIVVDGGWTAKGLV